MDIQRPFRSRFGSRPFGVFSATHQFGRHVTSLLAPARLGHEGAGLNSSRPSGGAASSNGHVKGDGSTHFPFALLTGRRRRLRHRRRAPIPAPTRHRLRHRHAVAAAVAKVAADSAARLAAAAKIAADSAARPAAAAKIAADSSSRPTAAADTAAITAAHTTARAAPSRGKKNSEVAVDA